MSENQTYFMGRHLIEKKKTTVENLFLVEKTLTSISKKFQKHVSTIERFVDRLKDNSKFNRKKGSGRIQLFKTDIRKILRKRKKNGKRQLKDIYEEAKTAKISKIS